MTLDAGRHPEGGRVRPGDALELVPPSVDHQGDVETQHEGDGDLVTELAAVDANTLE